MTDLIGGLTAELESLKTAISAAYDELDEADQGWLPKYDAMFATLREEAEERGSKAAPPEHLVVSAARKAYPAEYQRWKAAKRNIRRLEEVGQSTRAQVSAHQTRAREAGRLPTVQPRQGPRAVAS